MSGDWPAALSAGRFAGEQRALTRWLDAHRVTRGRCLDAGCGTGQWLSWLADRFEHASGVDVSAEMVAAARARLGDRAQVEQRALHQLDPAGYDLVFLGGVLMYIDDDQLVSTIEKVRSAVAPGGVLIAREATIRARTPRYRNAPPMKGLFTQAAAEQPAYKAIYRPWRQLRAALRDGGFVVERAQVNHSYKVADTIKGQLLVVNRMLGGRLAEDRELAERWTRRLFRLRHLLVTPYHVVVRGLGLPAFHIDNHWFVARNPS